MNKTRLTFLIVILLVLCAVFYCSGQTVQDSQPFLHAMHQTETSGRTGPILGDKGKALGPLQIHYEYWLDSGVKGNYRQCENLEYSQKVVMAYLNKYARAAVLRRDWETCARIHNGGPRGHKKKETIAYWQRFRKNLT
jgi:hypothetical protein